MLVRPEVEGQVYETTLAHVTRPSTSGLGMPEKHGLLDPPLRTAISIKQFFLTRIS